MISHLKEIFKSLHKHQVKYLLCGGVAVNLYGIPRMTADIDVLLEWSEGNLAKFEEAIAEHGYKSTLFFAIKTLLTGNIRSQYIKEKNLIAYSYTSETFRSLSLDVLIDVPVEFSECWSRKEVKHIKDIPVYILGLDDLILLKQYANREQDKADIANLKKFYRK
ncbi:MAG: nucleotidyl transferase AbiEii/AbiGii toxin family protein [Chitinophagales bacterium]|nr:nucleotidyl transferase AbiEii/AbiGii toxin family protein [Chitinophagales bacterium]